MLRPGRYKSLVKRIPYSISVACFAAVLLVSAGIVEADKPDFSGSYTLTGSKGAFKREIGKAWTLKASQTESAIEVTRVTEGHQNTYKCPLNGGEGRYSSPGGASGTCKARLKGKNLLLETLVMTRPQPNGPMVQVHTRERWELSTDLKTLTIKSDVDFPGSPVNGFQLVEPWTEIYKRN